MDAIKVGLSPSLNSTVSAGVELLVVGVFIVIILMVIDRLVNGKKKH